MKVDTKFGSIWDELPTQSLNNKKEKSIPTTQAEAMELYQAAESSVTNSTMKIWDSHNDMMAKSAEIRKVSERKKAVERQAQERIEQARELNEKAAEEKIKNSEILEAESLKRK
ncbi:MAG: hypothetical protein IJ597_03105 [Synergistaceae bacterium]|nr:hypothetical protein [Synergistaceae bacterium]